MVTLPYSSHLPIPILASIFDEVTNSYKFYWFLAILEQVREQPETRLVPLELLLARMVANVWYPTNYFRLSFGKQDRLGNVAMQLGKISGLPMDSPCGRVIETAQQHIREQDKLGKAILSLADYVPYRFLRPFFAQTLRGVKDSEVNCRIRQLAENTFQDSQPCLYRFVETPQPAIELHPKWLEYLQQHLGILTGFCLWHLVNYLQRNNPNVPNIPGKLFEPQERDLRLAREFWNLVLSQVQGITCIYSGQPLQQGNFSIDHFLPWRFVAHDQLWNLVPTPKEVNSAKSDNLPDPMYIDPLARLHYRAVQTVIHTPRASSLLEDYVLLFKVSAVGDFQNISFPQFCNTFRQVIAPQMQIAANMGFATGWRYTI